MRTIDTEHELWQTTDPRIAAIEDKNDFLFGDSKIICALFNLASKLEPRVLEFDTLVGDDASGRLPTLFLRKVLNNLRIARGGDNIQTLFIAGGSNFLPGVGSSGIESLIRRQSELGSILFSTEYIREGRSAAILTEFLQKKGMDVTIAAVTVSYELDTHQVNYPLYYGEIDDGPFLVFYIRHEYCGVEKIGPGPYHIVRASDYNPRKVREARMTINNLADGYLRLRS
ncbi:MAG: hypothetical protein Q7R77_02990 [Candidatus Daviesbacteria bacterium]|nr:hypothetical protein [Candidatus Daviesbacteria bacterium]